MRTFLLTVLFLAVSFAGCIGDETDATTDSVEVQTNTTAEFEVDPSWSEKPDPRFEPTVSFAVREDELEKGGEVIVDFDISDLEDYPFPLTFIDYAVFYEREPTPVQEGDASRLPGFYNRSLYGDAFHMFAFYVNDGQGFHELDVVIVKTGNPASSLFPNATQVQDYKNRILYYYGEWEPPEGVVIEVVKETITNTHYLLTPEGCYACIDGSSDAWGVEATGYLGAAGCVGYMTMTPGIDCAWVHIPENSWGEEFIVRTKILDSDFMTELTTGAPDVEFMETCGSTHSVTTAPAVESNSVSQEYIVEGADSGEIIGVIPEGAGCMVVMEFAWPAAFGGILAGGDGGVVQYEINWDEKPVEHPGSQIRLTQWETASCAGVGCGPADCPGLATNWNGNGCVWIPISESQWGQSFKIRQSSALAPVFGGAGFTDVGDPDAMALSECSAEATEISGYTALLTESGTIPEGTRCLVAFHFLGSPAVATFQTGASVT